MASSSSPIVGDAEASGEIPGGPTAWMCPLTTIPGRGHRRAPDRGLPEAGPAGASSSRQRRGGERAEGPQAASGQRGEIHAIPVPRPDHEAPQRFLAEPNPEAGGPRQHPRRVIQVRLPLDPAGARQSLGQFAQDWPMTCTSPVRFSRPANSWSIRSSIAAKPTVGPRDLPRAERNERDFDSLNCRQPGRGTLAERPSR